MRLKSLFLATLALAAIAAALATWHTLASRNPDADADAALAGRPLVATEVLAATRKVRITSPRNKEPVVLAAGADGIWRLESWLGLPANREALVGLFTQLNDARISRVATRDPARMEKLGMGVARLELLGQDGRPLFECAVGVVSADGKGSFVQLAKDAPALLTKGKVTPQPARQSWVDARIAAATAPDVSQVSEISIQPAGPTAAYVFRRPRQGQPFAFAGTLPKGVSIDAPVVEQFVEMIIGNMPMDDIVDAGSPAVQSTLPGAWRLGVRTFGGKSFSLMVSRDPAAARASTADAPGKPTYGIWFLPADDPAWGPRIKGKALAYPPFFMDVISGAPDQLLKKEKK